MAQFVNFLQTPTEAPDYSGYADLFGNLARGYQAAALPQQIKDEHNRNKFAQMLAEQQLDPKNIELDRQLKQAQIAKYTQGDSFANRLTGDVGTAYAIQELENQLGADDPRVIAAKEQLALQRKKDNSLIASRNALMDNSSVRSATNLTKLQLEAQDVSDGFMPGTNRALKITPEQQKDMMDQYGLQILKTTTDPDVRQKNLFASNIEQTQQSFDPKDLLRYTGIKGAGSKLFSQAKSAIGIDTPDYDKYVAAAQSAALEASQIRNFYKESVQPEMREELNNLTNPESWLSSPSTALAQFNAIKNVLSKELGTYRAGVKSSDIYKGIPTNEKTYRIRNSDTGEEMTVTAAKAREMGVKI